MKIVFEGIIIGLVTLASYAIGSYAFGLEEEIAHSVGQTMAFLTLSSTQLFHAYNVKSKHSVFSKKSYKNSFMNFAFILGFSLQVIVIYMVGVRDLFEFTPLTFVQFIICIGLSLVMVVIMEIHKLIERRKNRKI